MRDFVNLRTVDLSNMSTWKIVHGTRLGQCEGLPVESPLSNFSKQMFGESIRLSWALQGNAPPPRVTEKTLSLDPVDEFTRPMVPMPRQWLQRVPSPETVCVCAGTAIPRARCGYLGAVGT